MADVSSANFQKKINKRFNELEKKIEEQNKKIEEQNKKIEQQDREIDALCKFVKESDHKIYHLGDDIHKMKASIRDVDMTAGSAYSKGSDVESEVERITERIDEIDEKFKILSEKIEQMEESDDEDD